jgi:ABC-2 type transport system permease protein
MNATEIAPPPVLPEPSPVPEQTLRRLFLTLFLRGRSSRDLNKQSAPKSVGAKLAWTLLIYALYGCMALFFLRQPVFALAVYLHAMTFVFLGMFVAASAGEILFNKEEADILLHRPVSPRVMLWAKIRVLVEVSFWLAGAFNLVGLVVGFISAGNWRFPFAHLFSTTLEALFCSGCVVLVYQLCLRWFGRERLENLMTVAQVVVTIAAVMAGQILPQMVMRAGSVLNVGELSWWVNLLPPAWFAGFDDAFSGSARIGSWVLAALALGVTGLVLWLAFGKLARDYETGLQALNEMGSTRITKGGRRRWIDWLVKMPPLSWWLRDPVTRASFLLTASYLSRDRDVKLRVYPSIAPILIIPFLFLIRNPHQGDANDPGFGVPFSGMYLGMVPLLGLQVLQYSQQWQASDIFRTAPLAGPAALCHGARCAVLCFLAAPMMLVVGLIIWLVRGNPAQLILLLPGAIALPVFALVPHLGGHCVPLSQPTDAAKSASRALSLILVMVVGFGFSGVTSLAWTQGWFRWLILGEAVVAMGVYWVMRRSIGKAGWVPLDGRG